MNIFQEVFDAELASEERTENGGQIQGFANSFTCDSISPPLWAPSAPVGGHIISTSSTSEPKKGIFFTRVQALFQSLE